MALGSMAEEILGNARVDVLAAAPDPGKER